MPPLVDSLFLQSTKRCRLYVKLVGISHFVFLRVLNKKLYYILLYTRNVQRLVSAINYEEEKATGPTPRDIWQKENARILCA